MSDGKPRRAPRESVAAKVTALPRSPAQIVPLPAPKLAPAEAIEAAVAAVEPSTRTAPAVRPTVALPPPVEKPGDHWRALMEAQTMLGRGYEQALAEFAGTANAGMAVSRDAAVAMLSAKSAFDLVAIGNDYMRKGFDAFFNGAAKLSEIGVKTFSDASRPLLSPLVVSPVRT